MADEIEIEESTGARKFLRGRAHARQTLSIDGAASSAFGATTKAVAVRTTTDCTVEIGAAPDGAGATATKLYSADGWRDIPVMPGEKLIAVA